MQYSRKLGPPLVASAVAMIVVANFSIVQILAVDRFSPAELFRAIWPVALIATVAITLVMSFLYNSLEGVMLEMERRERVAVAFGMHDPLTGLANRILLNDRLSTSIERHLRKNEKFALLMLDLDHFKNVNDVLGHQVGDELLKGVAGRLSALSRDTDTVARLGGDEFVMIQADVKRVADVQRLCGRISQALARPFLINGRELTVGVSMGSVLAGQATGDATEYMRRVDIALYKAKADGRNCIRFFSDTMDAEVQRRARIEDDLRKALQSGEGLEVHYQPQIDSLGSIKGVEALLRWTHPIFGDLGPTEVVPIAEEAGLIEKLGEFVFREACRTARNWPQLFVAVNISPMQFTKSACLSERLKQIAEEIGVLCEQIELEITESVFIDHGQDCEKHIKSLREQGFRVALDDFGTGYSSLSYLRRFQVDKIKLDKSFADDQNVQGSVAIIRAAVMLAHALGLEVVAEGIETAEQEHVALEAGCDGLQGYRYAAAMPADSLSDYIVSSVRSVA